ncbi:MAG: glycosyltransferase family 39 protein, partial [candidate division WOR-3 bacterium]|nr:glycosyltransferase family 39 protein [candidate division WOR-3 bacterium]
SIARNLLEGHGFSMNIAPPYESETTVTPGYPFFVAGIYVISGGSRIAVVLIQLLLNLVLLAMLYRFIAKRFGERAALLVGVLFILELNIAIFTNQITTETLFTFFFIPTLILIVQGFKQERITWLKVIGAGLLLGAATLVRPMLLYFGVPLLLFALLSRFRWRKLLGWGLIVGLQLACIAPWVIRNRVVFGETFYSTVSDMNLMRYHAVPLKARLDGISREEAARQLTEEALQGKTYQNTPQYFRIVGAEARRYLLKHPLSYVGISIVGGLGTLVSPLSLHETGVYFGGQKDPPGESIMVQMLAELSNGRIISVLKMAWNERLSYYGTAVAVLFLIYGLFHLAKLGLGLRAYIIRGLKDPVMLLFLLTGIYSLSLLGLAVVPRLRVPVEPLLVSLAGIGIVARRVKKQASEHKRRAKKGVAED